MKNILFKNFLISLLGIMIAFNPLIFLYTNKISRASAQEAGATGDEPPDGSDSAPNTIPPEADSSSTSGANQITDEIPEDYQSTSGGDQPYVSVYASEAQEIPYPESAAKLADLIIQYSPQSGASGALSFDDIFSTEQDAKIIMKQTDLDALRSYYCVANSSTTPDFTNDMQAIYDNLSVSKGEVDADAHTKGLGQADYLLFLKNGGNSEFLSEATNYREKYNKYIQEARSNYGKEWLEKFRVDVEKIFGEVMNSGTANNDAIANMVALFPTIQCLTGYTDNQIKSFVFLSGIQSVDTRRLGELKDRTIAAIDNFAVIDIRIIKTLVYLVTPKNQGGAGHWRIRVRKLMQSIDRPYSNESDAVLGALKEESACNGMTAAECGRARGAEAQGDATVEDENGDQYEAYLASQQDNPVGNPEIDTEFNRSAHTDGKAIDISEVDDIRCTLIKWRRIGGAKSKKIAAKPIKLAWQTNEGYQKSGGNTAIDMQGMIKELASEGIRDLIDELGQDPSDYEGDLSQAGFGDIVGVIGKTLLSELFNSPSGNLSGYDINDTMTKIGSVYFADYLGIPREVFVNNINSISDFNIDDISKILGQAAIEKRLNLPFGSLNSDNPVKLLDDNGRAITKHDLEGTLLHIGLRKLEYEMNLDPEGLEGLIPSDPTVTQLPIEEVYWIVGRSVVEKELRLPKGTITDFRKPELNNANKFKDSLGEYKSKLILSDPTYLDNLFHIPLGTTKKVLVDSSYSPLQYITDIGQKRHDDTINGLRYFSANNTAYSLPGPTPYDPSADDTWLGAIFGKKESLRTVGEYTLSRLIGASSLFEDTNNQLGNNEKPDPEDVGIEAMRLWIDANLTRNKEVCKSDDAMKQHVVVNAVPRITTPTDEGGFDSSSSSSRREIFSDNIVISEQKAIQIGLEKGDLCRMFGYKEANGESVYSRIGKKLLFYGLANKNLSQDDKKAIDLMDTDPELRTDNPTIQFYQTRYNTAKNASNRIKQRWENYTEPKYAAINQSINTILELLNSATQNPGSIITSAKKNGGRNRPAKNRVNNQKEREY